MRNDLEQYKQAAQALGKHQAQNWIQGAASGNAGVWIAPSTGTTTTYAANTLVSTQ